MFVQGLSRATWEGLVVHADSELSTHKGDATYF